MFSIIPCETRGRERKSLLITRILAQTIYLNMLVTKGKLLITLPLRFLTYLCLSLAIIFLSGFLETTKIIHSANEALFFKRQNKPTEELTAQKYQQLCDSNAVQADDDVKRFYINRIESTSLIPITRMEWERIQEELFMGRQAKLCFMKGDVVYAVSADESTDLLINVTLQEVGSISKPEKYPVVDSNTLARHPEIKELLLAINQLADKDSSFRQRSQPVKRGLGEWKIFTDSIPGLEYLETTFIVGNYLYSAVVTTDYQQLEREIPGLKKNYTFFGSTLLIIGFLILFKLYRTVSGI
ncbi:MAG: hypothetical protein D3925_03220, partial [Candidatus Electrothrix sp. AR5]|nr:hypothetical protein [Candidatus Electrothrix sp. AR5]